MRSLEFGRGDAVTEIPDNWVSSVDQRGTTLANPPDQDVVFLWLSTLRWERQNTREFCPADDMLRHTENGSILRTEYLSDAVITYSADERLEEGVTFESHQFWVLPMRSVGGFAIAALLTLSVRHDENARELIQEVLQETWAIARRVTFRYLCSQSTPAEGQVLDDEQFQKKVASQPRQKITALNEADQQRLRDQRAVIERYLGNEDLKEQFTSAAGKLGAIRAILEERVFTPDQKYQLQCLGIVLGDVFVKDLGMEWIMVEDEYGRDPAVHMPNTTIILYPMTMISKRVERGEEFDVYSLYKEIVAQVEDVKHHAK